MSKMSQISAEMDEADIPTQDRNSLISRVSAGMHAAEKKIDAVKPIKATKPTQKTAHGEKSVIPAETVALAKQIREFAMRTHNVVELGGKKYVRVGTYQFLASLLGIVPSFRFDAESTQTEVWCECMLYKDNEELTRTTMYADKTEEFLRDKSNYAVLGTAQTRAFTRAMKNIYGYLVELAGFQSVAAEEVTL